MSDSQPDAAKIPDLVADQQTIIEVRGDKGAAPRPDTNFVLDAAVETAATPLSRLGDYDLLAEIGRGGMGVVFKARHVKLNRIVALKMILAGALAKADDLQRFNTEAAAAAQLQHPGIVALYEAGTLDNQPYFSMEYVHGSSLSQMISAGPLPGRRAAVYLEKTARAVHYAHQRGIIHRDLKPANILVDEHDQPKITDFGLAKLLQTDSGQTRTGTVIGTPSYMSPEQASASKDLGPAGDIYSLGAILFELITGRPPFRGETALATLTQVAEADAPPPRSIRPDIDVDLETICLKCLAKEPSRRYASAEALADDLQRYLEGEPIAARPLGRIERMLLWGRRKPTTAALLAVSLAALVALVAGVFAFAMMQKEAANEERRLRADADNARLLAQQRLGTMSWLYYLAEMRQVQQALDAANLDRAERLLKGWPRTGQLDPRDWEFYYLRNLVHGRFTLAAHNNGRATALAWHPDSRQLASAGGPPAKAADVKIWDTRTGHLLQTLTGHSNKIGALAYGQSGKLLASASEDGTVKLWDTQTGLEITTLPHPAARVTAVAIHPSGKLLSSADSSGRIWIWSLDKLGAADWHAVPQVWSAHAGEITCLAFSPEEAGAWLASAGLDQKVRLWEASTGRELRVLPPRDDSSVAATLGHQGPVHSLAFSHDGKLLASAGGRGARAGEVIVWDPATGEQRYSFTGLNDRMVSVTFSKPGSLAAGSYDGTLRIWTKSRPDLAFAGEPLRLRADAQGIYALAYSPNGQQLASAGLDGRVRLFNRNGGQESLTLAASPNSESAAFSKVGRLVAAAVGDRGRPGKVVVWRLDQPAQPVQAFDHPACVRSVAMHPDGKLLATGAEDRKVRLFDLDGTQAPLVLTKNDRTGHSRTVTCVVFSPDGKYLASASDDETIIVWNVAKRTVEWELLGHTDGVDAVAFSPDGKFLVSAGADRKVMLWDLAGGTHVVLGENKSWTRAVAFSPDGKLVASGSDDKLVRIFDVAMKTEHRKLEGSSGGVLSVAFHPDGKRLVSAGDDKLVRLWDLITGQEILDLEGSSGSVKCVKFSPDGRWLLAAGYHNLIRLWEAPRP
jgi:eukaryotic-like serine/threonine-protein kinase